MSAVYRALMTRTFPRCFLSVCKDVRPIMPVLSCANERPSFSTLSRAVGDRYRSRRSILWSCCAWCLSLTVGLTERTTSCCSQDVLKFLCDSSWRSDRSYSLGFFRSVRLCLRACGLQVLRQSRFAFIYFLCSDKAVQFGNSFCMPRRASQVVGVVLCASPALEVDILRYLNSPVMMLGSTVDTCPSSVLESCGVFHTFVHVSEVA